MAKDDKTKRVGIIDTIIITFITAVITLLASGFVSKMKYLDQKVDKDDYLLDKAELKEDINNLKSDARADRAEMKAHIDSRFEDFKDFMIELNKKGQQQQSYHP